MEDMNPERNVSPFVPASAAQDKGDMALAEVSPKETKPFKPIHYPYTHTPIPGALQGVAHGFGTWVDARRQDLISVTPSIIVNNSSNFIAAFQLVAEVLMYKSSSNDLIDDKSKPLWHKVIVQPPKNIYLGAFKNSKLSFNFDGLWKSDTYTNAWKNLSDIDSATTRDIAKASADRDKAFESTLDNRCKLKQFKGLSKEVVKAGLEDDLKKPNPPNIGKLSNKWSVRSGLAGITAMTVSALLPDEKDTPEKTEAMIQKSTDSPLSYVGLRLYQAINPLEWWQHKRQFSGLGMMAAGGLSFVSGFRQVAGKFGLEPQKYLKNPWQMAGGLITVAGGAQLMLGIDSQQAWTNFGTTQMGRLLTLPSSIHYRFKNNEQGGGWYLGAQTILQSKNVVAALIGGAEKKPDGTIIDHKTIREEARERIYQEHQEKKHHKQKMINTQLGSDKAILANPPENKISEADNVQLAMPERRAKTAAQEVA